MKILRSENPVLYWPKMWMDVWHAIANCQNTICQTAFLAIFASLSPMQFILRRRRHRSHSTNRTCYCICSRAAARLIHFHFIQWNSLFNFAHILFYRYSNFLFVCAVACLVTAVRAFRSDAPPFNWQHKHAWAAIKRKTNIRQHIHARGILLYWTQRSHPPSFLQLISSSGW